MKRILIASAICLAAVSLVAQFSPPASRSEWSMTLYVAEPPPDFVGPMPYWQPAANAPRIYYTGPSLNLIDPMNPPEPGTMDVAVVYPGGVTRLVAQQGSVDITAAVLSWFGPAAVSACPRPKLHPLGAG